jgi:hypothetical protein
MPEQEIQDCSGFFKPIQGWLARWNSMSVWVSLKHGEISIDGKHWIEPPPENTCNHHKECPSYWVYILVNARGWDTRIKSHREAGISERNYYDPYNSVCIMLNQISRVVPVEVTLSEQILSTENQTLDNSLQYHESTGNWVREVWLAPFLA